MVGTPGVMSTSLGTASTMHPAASADVTPSTESSIATLSRACTPSIRRACWYGSGFGFGRVTSSPQTVTWK